MGRKVDIEDVREIARAIGLALRGRAASGAAGIVAMHESPEIERLTSGRRRRTRTKEQGRAKAKRKVSAYQREFGRQLKKLKRAHPRTPVSKLMKRAHAATRRKRRGR